MRLLIFVSPYQNNLISVKQEISLKKIYDEVTEAIFAMSNVSFLNKEIEKKKLGDVYTLLCLRSAELRKAFG